MLVSLNYPADNNNSINYSNAIFNCSADAGITNLANATLYSNYNGSWQAIATNTLTGTSNSTTFIRDIYSDIGKFVEKQFMWNCLVYDENGNSVWGSSNYTFSSWSFNSSYTNTTTDNLNITLTPISLFYQKHNYQLGDTFYFKQP